MGYGLKVLTPGGFTQINTDSTAKNTYQFAAGTSAAGGSGSQYTTSAPSGGDWSTTLVYTGVTNSSALFFVRPTSRTGNPACYAYKGSGGAWGLTASGAYTWDWAVFVPATSIGNTPTTGEYGLVVYDTSGNQASGNIIFNGFDTKALRIQAPLTGSATADPGGTGYDWYAMQQQKHQRVRPANVLTNGFVRTWVTQFNNDTNKTISQTVAQTATFPATGGGTEEDPIEQIGILGDPTTLIAEI